MTKKMKGRRILVEDRAINTTQSEVLNLQAKYILYKKKLSEAVENYLKIL